MTLSKLADSIIREAEKKAHDIVEEANRHVGEAKRKERELVKERKHAVNEEVVKILAQYEKEKMLWAHLEGKRLIAEAKNKAVEASLDEFRRILKSSRKMAEYRQFMKRASERALSELKQVGRDKATYVVHVLKGEKSLLPRMPGVVVKEDLDPKYIGGLLMEFADGSVRVNMTLSELLNLKSTKIRGKIYTHLFK